jgi:hypothetical protein
MAQLKPFERCGKKQLSCGGPPMAGQEVDKDKKPMVDGAGNPIKFLRCAAGTTCNKNQSQGKCLCYLVVIQHTIKKQGAPREDEEAAAFPGTADPDYPGFNPGNPSGVLLPEYVAKQTYPTQQPLITAKFPHVWFEYTCACLEFDGSGPVRSKN